MANLPFGRTRKESHRDRADSKLQDRRICFSPSLRNLVIRASHLIALPVSVKLHRSPSMAHFFPFTHCARLSTRGRDRANAMISRAYQPTARSDIFTRIGNAPFFSSCHRRVRPSPVYSPTLGSRHSSNSPTSILFRDSSFLGSCSKFLLSAKLSFLFGVAQSSCCIFESIRR